MSLGERGRCLAPRRRFQGVTVKRCGRGLRPSWWLLCLSGEGAGDRSLGERGLRVRDCSRGACCETRELRGRKAECEEHDQQTSAPKGSQTVCVAFARGAGNVRTVLQEVFDKF